MEFYRAVLIQKHANRAGRQLLIGDCFSLCCPREVPQDSQFPFIPIESVGRIGFNCDESVWHVFLVVRFKKTGDIVLAVRHVPKAESKGTFGGHFYDIDREVRVFGYVL